jgi:hypothetical protein
MVTNLHILSIKMEIKLITKNKNVPKSSGKIVDRGNIDPHKIQIHDCLYCNLKLDSVHRCDNYKSMLFIVIENFRPNKASLYHSSNIFQIFLSVSFQNPVEKL